jgi:hypothetical protein
MKYLKKIAILSIFLALILIFNSCIGASIDIQMNSDGSGRLTMEYRVSRLLSNLGELDGNVSMPTIPLSRQDLQRTLDRIPGTRIISHSTRETLQDNIITAVIGYDNLQALLTFLDSNTERVSITTSEGTTSFEMIIHDEPTTDYDPNILAFMSSYFEGYNLTFSFSSPSASTLVITDGKGNVKRTPSSASITNSGRRAVLSMEMLDVLMEPDGLGIRISW